MLNTIAFLSLMATAVMAQSNPLIPSGISQSCTDFLQALNSDTSLQACTQPLISATEAYGPSASGNKAGAASVSSTLSTICSSDGCSDSLLRGKLTDFYNKCGAELTSSPNDDVRRIYDVLYVVAPFKQAICSKDDSGKYCVTETPGPSGGKALISTSGEDSPLSKYLVATSNGALPKRQTQIAMYPNTTTYSSSNIVFLLLKPGLPSDKLCTSCTRNILSSYITFESNVPYAYGLDNSLMLKGQNPLYTDVQKTCGKDFLQGSVSAAGGISDGIGSGSPRTVSMATESVLGVVAALAFGFVAVF
jgi:hypothetical protein